MIYQWVMRMIEEELEKARVKHPDWPDDVVHQAAIVGEEAGELIQAALKRRYEHGTINAMRLEAVHTIVTAIRFLEGG
jgi:NTP pyrophosphatase (non-canonical NTP hydrolase)